MPFQENVNEMRTGESPQKRQNLSKDEEHHNQNAESCQPKQQIHADLDIVPQRWSDCLQHTIRVTISIYMQVLFGLPILGLFLIQYVVLAPGLMSINNSNMKAYYFIYEIFNIVFEYVAIWGMASLMFGFWQMKPVIRKVGLPSMLIHAGLYSIKYHMDLDLLTPFYYLTFLAHHYFGLRMLQRNAERDSTERDGGMQNQDGKSCAEGSSCAQSQRLSPLPASSALTESQKLDRYMCLDGTPRALAIGMLVFLIVYGITAKVLLEKVAGQSLVHKIILRSIIFPAVFGLTSVLQYTLIIGKSLNLMERRMLQTGTLASIFTSLLRMMVVNSNSTEEMLILVFCSGVVEIVVRVSSQYRYDLICRLESHLRRSIARLRRHSTRVVSSNISSPQLQQSGRSTAPAGFLDLTTLENRSYLQAFRFRQTIDEAVFEVLLMISIPLVLFLIHPARRYTELETLADSRALLLSLVIQVPGELIVDFLSILLEAKFVGMPSIRPDRPIFLIIFYRSAIVSLALYFSVTAFTIFWTDFPSS
eukprot:TRINITY_DN9096_c0_g1_i3.p1 TRINITY_DN9096_c0_g1~~TRINITY_DN9096_c0_g1_i3.p1  ORF type:complete len:533 (-),score=94.47 TRINITY_DN9096_c0_g1_i3:79-1677(-)